MGFVGLTLAVFLASRNNTVHGIENDPERLSQLARGRPGFFEPKLEPLMRMHIAAPGGDGANLTFARDLSGIFDSLDYVFVTVGTPTANRRMVLTHLRESVGQIACHLDSSDNSPTVIIKSTLSPRTTCDVVLPVLEGGRRRRLGADLFLATNPEFLREGTAIDDQFDPHVIVVGTQDPATLERMERLVDASYPAKTPRFFTNFATSELIKYSNNAFLATKISFINSMANLCQRIPGASVDDIAKIIGLDPRIGPLFLRAGPGYGGSCLPKDLSSLISVLEENRIDPGLFVGVQSVNDGQTDRILGMIRDNAGGPDGKTLTVLGLSFKEDSDDIRESRSIRLIERLLQLHPGCKIRVHDPMAIQRTREIFGGRIAYFDRVEEALRGSDCAVVMTPWGQYSDLSDFTMMSTPLVIDTRRIIRDTGRIRYVPYGSPAAPASAPD